ncbi:MAG: DUF4390 domain-containing protein [bacterium]
MQDRSKLVMKYFGGVNRYLMAALFLLLLLPGTHPPAWAFKAEIVDFTITRGKDYIYIDAQVKGAFTSGINEAIASGIPTTFRYYLELVSPRQFWFDKKPYKRLIQHKVEYDTLKKEYQVTLDDGIAPQVRITRDEREMKKWMAGLESFKFLPSQELLPANRNYMVRLKAEMKCIKMPFPLNYSFPLNYLLSYLVSFLDVDTSWVTSPIPAAISDKAARTRPLIRQRPSVALRSKLN